MAAREQRLVFGEVADIYHRVRPSYPPALIDFVVDAAGGSPVAVEIGAGTGKATELLAPRCARLVAIEPSAEMAAVAAHVVADSACVQVVVTGFEEWDAPAELRGAVDLVLAAQSWHWLDQQRAPRLVAALLRPGGVLALVWNRPMHEQNPLREPLDAVYADLAPSLQVARPWEHSVAADLEALAGSGLFRDFETAAFAHQQTYSTADYLDLMRTQSDHRLLTPEQLERLQGIGAVIDAAGGRMTIDYSTIVIMGRRG